MLKEALCLDLSIILTLIHPARLTTPFPFVFLASCSDLNARSLIKRSAKKRVDGQCRAPNGIQWVCCLFSDTPPLTWLILTRIQFLRGGILAFRVWLGEIGARNCGGHRKKRQHGKTQKVWWSGNSWGMGARSWNVDRLLEMLVMFEAEAGNFVLKKQGLLGGNYVEFQAFKQDVKWVSQYMLR